MDGWMDGWMDEWMDGWMDVSTSSVMYVHSGNGFSFLEEHIILLKYFVKFSNWIVINTLRGLNLYNKLTYADIHFNIK